MSELSALLDRGDAYRAWFVAPDELIELRMRDTSWRTQHAAAKALGARFWITKGQPPVHHFPQEWLIWDRLAQSERNQHSIAVWRPIKRLTTATIDGAEMWARHRGSTDHG